MSRVRPIEGLLIAGVLFAGACAEAPADTLLSPEAQRGREVYLFQSAPACGTCHALKDAGTRGRLGPDLDQLRPSYDRVLRAVVDGINLMPAQRGMLTPEQIKAVSRYVAEATTPPDSEP